MRPDPPIASLALPGRARRTPRSARSARRGRSGIVRGRDRVRVRSRRRLDGPVLATEPGVRQAGYGRRPSGLPVATTRQSAPPARAAVPRVDRPTPGYRTRQALGPCGRPLLPPLPDHSENAATCRIYIPQAAKRAGERHAPSIVQSSRDLPPTAGWSHPPPACDQSASVVETPRRDCVRPVWLSPRPSTGITSRRTIEPGGFVGRARPHAARNARSPGGVPRRR